MGSSSNRCPGGATNTPGPAPKDTSPMQAKTTAILATVALAALAIPLAPQPVRIPLLLAAGWLAAQIAILAHTWKHPLHGRTINWTVAALAVLTCVGSYAASAQALELGISDDQASLDQRNEWATNTNAHWERLIVSVGQPGVAARIREIHAAGRSVILTVGGLGTSTHRPNFTFAVRYIQSLPKADRYTIANEPDLDGYNVCAYRKGWLAARRILGRRLLFGDLSPHYAVSWTKAMLKRCGHLPKRVGFAVHPYEGNFQAGMWQLPSAQRILKRAGLTADLWLTEFGYRPELQTRWPLALSRAAAVHPKVLIVYTAQGPSWDTRPGAQAWAAIRSAA